MKLSSKLNNYKKVKCDERKTKKNKSYHKCYISKSRVLSNSADAVAKRNYRERQNVARNKETERKREWRKKQKGGSPECNTTENNLNFAHRSTKCRALQRLRNALPKSPMKRAAAIQSYLKSKSPTVKTVLQEITNRDGFYKNVVEDIKTVVKAVKNKRSKDALSAMQVIVSSVSGEHVSESKCARRLSAEFQLPTKRVLGGKQIRMKVLRSERSCWSVTERKTRRDAMSETAKREIYEFWSRPGVSRPTGNKADVKRQRISPKVYASHMIHVLEKSQTEVYHEFLKTQPEMKISQRLFEKYRPFYVRAVREKDRMTCMCRYHVEAAIVFRHCNGFRNDLLSREVASRDDAPSFGNLSDVVASTLCDERTKQCLDRHCTQCGVNLLHFLPQEMEISEDVDNVSWERYEYLTSTCNGKANRKLTLVKKSTSPGVLFEYFRDLMEAFPAHQHRSYWQQKQFRSLVENVPISDCVVVHDFSENYRCGDREEVQSTYFKRTEVTVHVSIIHRHAVLELDGVESTCSNPNIITEHFYVISPDLIHDHEFVKKVQAAIAQHLREISYPAVTTMHEYTDGCPSQYKSRHCVKDISTAAADLGYRRLIRNYYETSHAKGPQDAAGGLLKRQADVAVLRGSSRIRSASDLYDFAVENLQSTNSSTTRRRIFQYLPEFDRYENTFNIPPVSHIRQLHQIVSSADDVQQVFGRDLSCYDCENCLSGHQFDCTSMSITGVFRPLFTNIPVTDTTEPDDVESELELISPGMIVAVVADDPIVDYYLMEISKGPHTIRKDVVDAWNAIFEKGTNVMSGHYFEQVGDNPLDYRRIWGKMAMVYSAAYVYTCDSVKSKMLQLSEETHLNIIARITELMGDD